MAKKASLRIQSDLKKLSEIRRFIELQAREAGLSEENTSRIRLAVDEASANIINHGYGESGGKIDVNVEYDAGRMTVSLVDSAPAFNPLLQDNRINPESPLEDRAIGGMGIIFIRDSTDTQEYRYTEAGENILSLTIHGGVQKTLE